MAKPVEYHLGKFPPTNIDWLRLIPLIAEANKQLGLYDGLIKVIPNANILLSPLLGREAVLSSKIEGTNISLSEVLEIAAGGNSASQSKLDDAQEVLNYRSALSFAAHAMDERPFSLHLLREAHELLMTGVRGQDKEPGAFRKEQNWIGKPNSSIDDASFVPIPTEQLAGGMEHWFEYLQSTEEPDMLVQLAVIHVEFEALHPFLDGNGRIGRMIIPLFLYAKNVLSGPNFYMSGYFEARREDYIEAMRAVSRDGAWTAWCEFFLKGIIDQASENQGKAQAILDLHQRMREFVPEVTHSQYAGLAVDFIFAQPVFSTPEFVKATKIPEKTAARILGRLKDKDVGVLDTVREGKGRSPAIFAFGGLLEIVL